MIPHGRCTRVQPRTPAVQSVTEPVRAKVGHVGPHGKQQTIYTAQEFCLDLEPIRP